MLIHSAKELAMYVMSYRKKYQLSQAAVAKLVGLKQQTISDFENKPESTKLATLFHILSAVNLDIKLLTKEDVRLAQKKWKEEW